MALGSILDGFWEGLGGQVGPKIHPKSIKKDKIKQTSMKNRMFLATSILDGFWEGFGRVLGDQNP